MVQHSLLQYKSITLKMDTDNSWVRSTVVRKQAKLVKIFKQLVQVTRRKHQDFTDNQNYLLINSTLQRKKNYSTEIMHYVST